MPKGRRRPGHLRPSPKHTLHAPPPNPPSPPARGRERGKDRGPHGTEYTTRAETKPSVEAQAPGFPTPSGPALALGLYS